MNERKTATRRPAKVAVAVGDRCVDLAMDGVIIWIGELTLLSVLWLADGLVMYPKVWKKGAVPCITVTLDSGAKLPAAQAFVEVDSRVPHGPQSTD